jgi:hypothetical protein
VRRPCTTARAVHVANRMMRRHDAWWVMFMFATGCGGDDDGADPMEDPPAGTSEALDGSEGSHATTDDEGSMPAGGLPCDVASVLAANCTSCHADPPVFGAPMPLVEYDDLLVPSVGDPTRPVWELVAERIEDPARPMPQPPATMLDDEKAILRAWAAGGAPTGTEDSCDVPDGDEPGDDVGPDALPCEPTMTFTAHSSDGDGGFAVPVGGDENIYMCFAFANPFGAQQFATAWAPIVDDERVLHHWVLYRTETPQVDGSVAPCNMPGDAQFVAGWAPGTGNFEMPADVAVELGGEETWFILNVHYNNSGGHLDAEDASGVALCTTDTPREHTAGVLWLGTYSIDIPAGATEHAVAGECPSWLTSYLTEPVYALSSFPHMHKLGRKLRTDILRGGSNGPIETLVDVPAFDFQTQLQYVHEPVVEIRPGDAIRTTCTYDNPSGEPIHFGENTEDEMCFNFVTLYPIEALGDSRMCVF